MHRGPGWSGRFFLTSNFDLWYFCSLLTYKSIQYLIWKIWLISVWRMKAKVLLWLLIWFTRKPASRVFLAPPEGLTKFLSSHYHAWQLLLSKFFDSVKLEFWPPGPHKPPGVRGQIWIAYSVLRYMKVKPYQFGLATISGFREHSNITGLRTNRNQLVNIYLIA